MARAIWKGAISFGLVHIPVALVSATSSQGVDFDWLDSRSMDPAGYKRVNKVTGKEATKGELDMAKRLVQDMSADRKPEDYRDSFEDKIMALVEKKAHEGKSKISKQRLAKRRAKPQTLSI